MGFYLMGNMTPKWKQKILIASGVWASLQTAEECQHFLHISRQTAATVYPVFLLCRMPGIYVDDEDCYSLCKAGDDWRADLLVGSRIDYKSKTSFFSDLKKNY
uniref:Uncharacterized protein n=1 Tax=Glossina pallidipes TaxID=7398 RepID=A0A1B0AHL6_GLOPL